MVGNGVLYLQNTCVGLAEGILAIGRRALGLNALFMSQTRASFTVLKRFLRSTFASSSFATSPLYMNDTIWANSPNKTNKRSRQDNIPMLKLDGGGTKEEGGGRTNDDGNTFR